MRRLNCDMRAACQFSIFELKLAICRYFYISILCIKILKNFETLLILQEDIEKLVNDTDNYGCSALHYSSMEGQLQATDDLMKIGAQLSMKTNNKDTALHFAARFSYFWLFRFWSILTFVLKFWIKVVITKQNQMENYWFWISQDLG